MLRKNAVTKRKNAFNNTGQIANDHLTEATAPCYPLLWARGTFCEQLLKGSRITAKVLAVYRAVHYPILQDTATLLRFIIKYFVMVFILNFTKANT